MRVSLHIGFGIVSSVLVSCATRDGFVRQGSTIPSTELACANSNQVVLKKGQSTVLSWSYPVGQSGPSALVFRADKGTVTPSGTMSAVYQAPASVPAETVADVLAQSVEGKISASCKILLMSDEDFVIEDDGTTRGAVGKVYVLPTNTSLLPDFTPMTPVAQILLPSFDVSTRRFEAGFPGLPDLFEWFGIRFQAQLIVPASGNYVLRLSSDDGSKLSLDGTLLINNDGAHPARALDGTVYLEAGNHALLLDYFQGPRYHIALELFWKKPGDSQFVLIPPDNFLRPL